MTVYILGLIALLLLSGFFSSSELAYIVANKLKVELRARKNNLAAKYAQYFINHPQTFFSTILISNNIKCFNYKYFFHYKLILFFNSNGFKKK